MSSVCPVMRFYFQHSLIYRTCPQFNQQGFQIFVGFEEIFPVSMRLNADGTHHLVNRNVIGGYS